MLALRCRAPWQLIVVDNGSTDGTWQWLRSIVAPPGATLETLQEPTQGAARARNVGLRAARGDILAFTDDDCYPTGSYLNDILDVFASPTIDWCGGRVLLYDVTDLPITIKTSDTATIFAPRSFIPAGAIHGANMAFRRRVLAATGPFDVLLGPGSATGSGDDTDLFLRASECGYTGMYAPVPTVLHHHRRKSQTDLQHLRRAYDLGRGACYFKHLLNKPTRRLVAKNWYWHFKAVSLHRPGSLLREVQGALIYLWHDRLRGRRQRTATT